MLVSDGLGFSVRREDAQKWWAHQLDQTRPLVGIVSGFACRSGT